MLPFKVFRIVCDKCGHFDCLEALDRDKAKELAEKRGWKIEDEKFYCKECE
jgi:hypothetical protein